MNDGVILLLLLVIALMALIGRDHAGPAGILEDVSAKVHNADWQRCVTPQASPLLQVPSPRINRNPARPSDGGTA